MTNKEILSTIQGLSQLEELDVPLSIKTNYILARDRQILTPFVDIINNQQIKFYKELGTETDKNIYTVSKEQMPLLEEKLNELLTINNDISIIKLKIEDFGDNNIPFGTIEKLLPIIEE